MEMASGVGMRCTSGPNSQQVVPPSYILQTLLSFQAYLLYQSLFSHCFISSSKEQGSAFANVTHKQCIYLHDLSKQAVKGLANGLSEFAAEQYAPAGHPQKPLTQSHLSGRLSGGL